jgi:hypothetical protein
MHNAQSLQTIKIINIKMGKTEVNFKQSLNEMQEFLSSRKKITELAEKANVSLRTVYDMFAVEKFKELKGKQIDAYRCAIEMINEINSLQKQAIDALNNK